MSQVQALRGSGRVRSAPAVGDPKPDLLLISLGALILTNVWRIQDMLPLLGSLRMPLLISLATVGIWMMRTHPARRLSCIRESKVLRCILVLCVIMIVGAPFAMVRALVPSFLLRDFFPSVLFMVMIATAVRSFKDLEWLVMVLLMGGLTYASYTLLNFKVGPGGRLSNLFYYDANDFALLLACIIPITVYLARGGEKPLRRLLAVAALGLCVLMLMKSGSRGGFLGFVAVMLYVLLRFRSIPTIHRLGVVVAGVGLLAVVGSSAYWASMRTLLNPQEDYNWVGESENGRMEVWKRGVGYMMMRPVTGWGARNYSRVDGRLSPQGQRFAEIGGKGVKWTVAHNSFVEIGVDNGVTGLLAFLGAFFFAFRSLAHLRPKNYPGLHPRGREVALAQSLAGSLVAFMVAGFFVSAWFFAVLYVLFGMCIGLEKLVRMQHAVRAPMPVPATAHRQFRRSSRVPTYGAPLPGGS